MSVAWPDGIPDDVKAALDDALHAVFEQTVSDPHTRGELPVAQSADVEEHDDGRYLVHIWWPNSLQAYLDATDAGDNFQDVDDHADNPGMVIYETLRDHGIPVPTDDPYTGVMLDRETDKVDVQIRVDPDDFADSGGDN